MKMGCVHTKPDINDTHPNIFNVINVDDQRNPVSKGKLEVTEIELIYHQKGRNPTKWPLRSLRKYGWDVDTNIFSIECGRRSPTGPGYYAFKSRKAEHIFNLVQQRIIGGVQDNNTNVVSSDNWQFVNNANNIDSSVLGDSAGPPVQRRPAADGNHLYPGQPTRRSHIVVLSRPGSISSNGGQLSPTTISPPPVITEVPPLEHNNNKRNSGMVMENGIGPPHYANLASSDVEATSHVYMNVDTKEIVNSQTNFTETREYQREISEEIHCYANIDTRDVVQHSTIISNLVTLPNSSEIVQMYSSNSVPCTPTAYTETDYVIVREVNYAELDLDPATNDKETSVNGTTGTTIQNPTTVSLQAVGQQKPASPTRSQKKSYATIDFPKTIALSQSINPNAETEEGSRKTRHNSTINSLSD